MSVCEITDVIWNLTTLTTANTLHRLELIIIVIITMIWLSQKIYNTSTTTYSKIL